MSIPVKISNQLARTLFHFRFSPVASWRKGDLGRGARSMVADSGKPEIEDYKQHVRQGSPQGEICALSTGGLTVAIPGSTEMMMARFNA